MADPRRSHPANATGDWFVDVGNWSGGLPASGDDAVITSGTLLLSNSCTAEVLKVLVRKVARFHPRRVNNRVSVESPGPTGWILFGQSLKTQSSGPPEQVLLSVVPATDKDL